eukprot:TRINITY_DN133_c0_g1_i2.p1 TRINITY_DN133_c0_g1~~TRINITY_DN133_c0_g1_i2.p1  ORF type:complete len:202 (-),score=69.40 TRINITY_DN133_c0_g1_i2:20-604(-)
MFLVDWFFDVLNWLGLYGASGTLLLLGLDNAGKTTLMGMLKNDSLGEHIPTYNPTAEELTVGKINFTAWDLGGHKQARKIWGDYYAQADGIVYLVDSAEPERFEESREALNGLLSSKQLSSDIPVLILGNKIDLDGACSRDKLIQELGVLTTGQSSNSSSGKSNERPMEVFMCSLAEEMGFREGFEWLAQYLKD